MRLSLFHTMIDSMIQEVFFMKKNNDFPLRSAAKEIKMSFTLAAVIDLILGCVMLFVPAHVTQLLCVLVGAGITIYGLFNILSFIFSRGTVAYSLELAHRPLRDGVRRVFAVQPGFSVQVPVHRARSADYGQQHLRHQARVHPQELRL